MPLPHDGPSWIRAGIISFLLLTCLLGSVAFQNSPLLVSFSDTATEAQIQAALDALPPNGEVRLGPGNYLIHQPLRLRHDFQTLRGSGPETLLRLADKAQCPVVLLGPALTERSHPATHLHLADLTIDGNRANQATEHWRNASDGSVINNNGVDVWKAEDVVIERVAASHCRSGGLVAAQARRLVVRDFDAYDNQFDGLACYQTEDSRFDDLRLHDNLSAGLSLDLSFDHNTIARADLTGNDLGVFMRDSRDNSFQDLSIARSRNHGVFMAQTATESGGTWRFAPGTECSGNTFSGLTVTASGGRAFQVNDASCTNNTITVASFQDNALGGLAQPRGNLVTVRALSVR